MNGVPGRNVSRPSVVLIEPHSYMQELAAPLPATSVPRVKEPAKTALAELRADEANCTRCPLYKFGTQVVPGEGRAHSRLMMVGEQPGDKEDLAGRPFVGPAGRLLDEALEQAGTAT